MNYMLSGVMAVFAVIAFVGTASADWAAGVTTATASLSTDLIAVGGVILGLVCLIYGFRVVKGMLAR